jgi:uncharacterized repeat protein (TIGR01451 family)/LPXTG-motif cell wall-anchored protein
VSKAVNNATPAVGDTVTFTVTLASSGPDAATNVAVNDLLPAGVAFVSATPSQGSYNSSTGVWTIGTVIPGATKTLGMQATVTSSTSITNTATITNADQFDPDTSNNSASATLNAVLPPTTTTTTTTVPTPTTTTTTTTMVPTTTTTTRTTQPSTGTLPHTGTNSDRTGAFAMLAVMIGAALTTFARRRRTAA